MDEKLEGKVTERDILEFAINTEKEAAQHYLAAADSSTDEQVQALLIDMANEERGHEKKLMELMGKVEAQEPLVKPFEAESISENRDLFDNTTLSDDPSTEDVIRFGMAREKATMELYEVLSHLVSAGVFSKLLNHLVNEERGHMEKFEKLLP